MSGSTQFSKVIFEHGEKVIKTTQMSYRYANKVRLHQDEKSPFVNFVQIKEVTEWIGKKNKAERIEATI